MKRLITYFVPILATFLFASATVLQAQIYYPINQPEQDACGAIKICTQTYTAPLTYQGYGLLQQIPAGACLTENAFSSTSAGGSSMYLELDIATAGNIIFTITPVNTADDYDFAVINITSSTCSTFVATDIIRCNANDAYNTPGGVVGLNTTSTLTSQAAGVGPPFCQQIAANAGDKYLVLINFSGNYSNATTTPGGFTFSMVGSTATLLTGAIPHLDTIAKSCDNSQTLSVHLTKPVLCSSLQANGSDFLISPAAGTVSVAAGAGCAGPVGTTQNIFLTFASALPAGNYALKCKNGTDGNTLLDACGNAVPLTDSIKFHVSNPLTINLGPDTATCIHNSFQFHPVITGGPFNTLNYKWTPSTFLVSDTALNAFAYLPTANTTYTLTVTPDSNGVCQKTATIKLDVLQGFYLANHDTVVCKGASVLLNAVGDTRYIYTWTPSQFLSNLNGPTTTSTPDSTTSYTVTASHAGCYDSANHITIGVEPIPTVYIGQDLTLCYGDTLHMNPSIIPSNYLNYSYSWTPPQYFNAPTSVDPIFMARDTATLTLTVTTPAGCSGSATRVINVIPNNFIIASNDTGICPRDTADLHVTGAISYVWTPVSYITGANTADPKVSPLTTTLYTVVGTNNLGCRDTLQVNVTVHPEAVINLPDTVRLFAGEQYQLDPGGNCLYFSWFPLLGLSNPNIANPLAGPDVNTRYLATASTEYGCSAIDSVVIMVDLGAEVDVPNAFTPSTGANNILTPVHRGNVVLNYFRIYNRWGARVFESSSFETGWDGQLNNTPQPMGVYVYVLKATLPNGRVVNKQGNITLLR